MKNRTNCHDTWLTPRHFFETGQKKYGWRNLAGGLDAFDPCPPACDLTKFNGLEIAWPDKTFCNPGYSLPVKTAFILHAIEQTKTIGSRSVFLLPVSTSTKLFHQVVKPSASKIVWIEGRIPFEGVNTKDEWVNAGTSFYNLPYCLDLEIAKYPRVKQSGQHDSMLTFFGEWDFKE